MTAVHSLKVMHLLLAASKTQCAPIAYLPGRATTERPAHVLCCACCSCLGGALRLTAGKEVRGQGAQGSSCLGAGLVHQLGEHALLVA